MQFIRGDNPLPSLSRLLSCFGKGFNVIKSPRTHTRALALADLNHYRVQDTGYAVEFILGTAAGCCCSRSIFLCFLHSLGA